MDIVVKFEFPVQDAGPVLIQATSGSANGLYVVVRAYDSSQPRRRA